MDWYAKYLKLLVVYKMACKKLEKNKRQLRQDAAIKNKMREWDDDIYHEILEELGIDTRVKNGSGF